MIDDMMTGTESIGQQVKTQLADLFQSHYMELCAFIELSWTQSCVELEVMNR